MNVSDAVDTRMSCRAFTDQPVDGAVVRRLLEKASRAPSGGNVQPWRIYALTGQPLQGLVDKIDAGIRTNPMGTPTEYDIYPKGLTAPYRDYRYKVGEDMYGLLGIPREDKDGPPWPAGAELQVLRRTCGIVHVSRPPDGPTAMVGCRHVPANHYAARPRRRPAYLRARGVGDVVSRSGRPCWRARQ